MFQILGKCELMKCNGRGLNCPTKNFRSEISSRAESIAASCKVLQLCSIGMTTLLILRPVSTYM